MIGKLAARDQVDQEQSPNTLIYRSTTQLNQNMDEHRVIVTADDFGACKFIDDGIREAIKKGAVSCVSAFINFEERVNGKGKHNKHPWGNTKAV